VQEVVKMIGNLADQMIFENLALAGLKQALPG
jgi:hypothetical protein